MRASEVIGIFLQLLGGAWLVGQAFSTSRKLHGYKINQIKFDETGAAIEVLASEVGSQFANQLIGFILLMLGAAFQIYAMYFEA